MVGREDALTALQPAVDWMSTLPGYSAPVFEDVMRRALVYRASRGDIDLVVAFDLFESDLDVIVTRRRDQLKHLITGATLRELAGIEADRVDPCTVELLRERVVSAIAVLLRVPQLLAGDETAWDRAIARESERSREFMKRFT